MGPVRTWFAEEEEGAGLEVGCWDGERGAEDGSRLKASVWLREREGGWAEARPSAEDDDDDKADLRHWTYLRATEWRSHETPLLLKTCSTRVASSEGMRGWT
jgi:hypothetical protein